MQMPLTVIGAISLRFCKRPEWSGMGQLIHCCGHPSWDCRTQPACRHICSIRCTVEYYLRLPELGKVVCLAISCIQVIPFSIHTISRHQ